MQNRQYIESRLIDYCSWKKWDREVGKKCRFSSAGNEKTLKLIAVSDYYDVSITTM